MTKEELLSYKIEGPDPLRDAHYVFKIGGQNVSVVKWGKKYYDGEYEIYSFEALFYDVKRFSSIEKLLEFINELEESSSKQENHMKNLARLLSSSPVEVAEFLCNNELPKLREGYVWDLEETVKVIRVSDGNEIFNNFWTRVTDKDGIKVEYFEEIVEILEKVNYHEDFRRDSKLQ